MVLEAKIEENREKNASKNDVFFACVFEWVLERFWEGFGSFGSSLAFLGTLLSLFFQGGRKAIPHLSDVFVNCGPKRVQEVAKRWFWKGFGKGLGGQNGEKIEISSIFLICFSRL